MSSELPPAQRARPLLAGIRGYVAFAAAGFVLLLSDPLQRTLVAGAARLFPGARPKILTSWIQAMRFVVLDFASVALGGARLESHPRIPSGPGVLVVMNHQSLLDIPLVVRALEGIYPRIVTRRRYTRGIPLISHMVRLYQYPLVDPQATSKEQVLGLRNAAQNGDTPLVIYPEGSRSRTGELAPWRRAGLRTLLETRQWQVYVMVADGLWRSRSASDFMRDISDAKIRVKTIGPFESPPSEAEVEEFIGRIEGLMAEALVDLRAAQH